MKWLFAVVAILVLAFFISGRRAQEDAQTAGEEREFDQSDRRNDKGVTSLEIGRSKMESPAAEAPRASQSSIESLSKEKNAAANQGLLSSVREYTIEDGVAVIEGDIVIGLPGTSGRAAQVPKIATWPSREIPYFIQPSLPNPDRIAEAISFFDNTAVIFVPYTNQRDVIVFENANGRCKSYMGKIGGKQPIYLAPNCGAREIAHELMHAIGFIHEQNRTDRDAAIRINPDAIQPSAIVNFEKFPRDYMKLSGLSPFDFTSLMLYPPSMFSRNGEPTFSSVTGTPVQSSERLSPLDVARINAFYGSL